MRRDQDKIVLIVDDEDLLRKLSRLILERAGYGVLLASNSQEALVISRGYSGQIHLLFSDIEMPGMDGMALGRQITVERPGIAVLLTSANPCYAGETGFAFLAKPFSPEKLQTAVGRMLESQPQTVAQAEFEPIPSLGMANSSPRPEISTPYMQTAGAGGAKVLEFPPAMTADQAEHRSGVVLAEPEQRSLEAVTLIRGEHRNTSNMAVSTMRSAGELVIATRKRKSRLRLPVRGPVWAAAAAAALVLAMAPFSLHRINEGLSATPYAVSLQGVRGLTGEAEAPAGKTLLLNLDVSNLRPSGSYEIQIVNGVGLSLWRKVVPAQGSQIRTKAAPLQPGTHFVRVYGRTGELLKEYELRVTETQ